ncbi:TonB-dependent siderophore receptor [Parasphingopyxis sp.]|uniref:TonB-dependent receptor plug domain-containing protein n=1 Tax=Parasphingopyxis sp. TaxID=1920299 RepID=UPI002604AA13|nr:TonB-dependent receptor [Parasphingopyxis sp.]
MRRSCWLLASGSLLAVPAYAQNDDSADAPPAQAAASVADGQDYAPEFFARFSPNTALDMVRQIPGFAIQQGDERRGLGQGGDNVLINGERVSGKSNDAVTTLGRISASNVIRIEVRDAASLDIPGLSGQVVNIVAETTGISGNFAWNPQFRPRITNPRLTNGEISVSGTQGAFDYTISLSNSDDSFRGGAEGPELVFDTNGQIIARHDEVATFSGDRPQLAGTFRYDGPGSSVGNLNLSYERWYNRVSEDSIRTGQGLPDRTRFFRDREDEWNFEIGGDFEFALGPGRLKLIGLRRFERSPFETSLITDFVDGTPSIGDIFIRTLDEGEWIARAEYGWAMGGDWQVAVEGALNTLDVRSQLSTLDPNGDFQPVILPNSNSEVEEERAEINITYGTPLTDSLTLQASIGGEYSTISQSGEIGLTRTFYRPKGFLSLAWRASDALDIRVRVEREVGQLNFSDFVASSDLAGEREDAANPNLVPPQSWNYEIEATQQLGEFGSITARLYYEQISDIVDQIPIGATAEAPGNIDSAKRYGIEWNSTFNFDPLGWRGGRLDIEAAFQRTRVRDPLTGENRSISSNMQRDIEIELRHDVPGTDWAWGLEYEEYLEAPGFRLSQTNFFRARTPFVGAYIEHKDVFGLRVRGGVYNLLDRDELFTRTFFVNRRDGPINFIEDRVREFGPIFSFQIAGSF